MKKINPAKLALVVVFLGAVNLFAQTDPGAWTPPLGSPGAQVQWVEYDMSGTGGKLWVKMVGLTPEYYFDWSVTDMAVIARAHAFYTSLLTAKTSGIPIHIRHTVAADNQTRIQVIHLE